jgi:hypothetical protein
MSLYTTKEAISDRLRGRVTVGGSPVPFAPSVADNTLIERVLGQVEARINAKLGRVYKLPLTLSDAGTAQLLASVTEKLACCEILMVHSSGDEQAVAGVVGVDRSYTGLLCRAGKDELEAILDGSIPLAGEETQIGEDGIVSISNYSRSKTRSPITTRADAGDVAW